MSDNLNFKKINNSGTSLQGYLYPKNLLSIWKDEYKDTFIEENKKTCYNVDMSLKLLNLSFEEIIARLYNLSNQEIFDQGDNGKTSFEVFGTFKGEPFTLYDYKKDFDIHIGGTSKLDVKNFRIELDELIMKASPKNYKAKTFYHKKIKYKYPQRKPKKI